MASLCFAGAGWAFNGQRPACLCSSWHVHRQAVLAARQKEAHGLPCCRRAAMCRGRPAQSEPRHRYHPCPHVRMRGRILPALLAPGLTTEMHRTAWAPAVCLLERPPAPAPCAASAACRPSPLLERQQRVLRGPAEHVAPLRARRWRGSCTAFNPLAPVAAPQIRWLPLLPAEDACRLLCGGSSAQMPAEGRGRDLGCTAATGRRRLGRLGGPCPLRLPLALTLRLDIPSC